MELLGLKYGAHVTIEKSNAAAPSSGHEGRIGTQICIFSDVEGLQSAAQPPLEKEMPSMKRARLVALAAIPALAFSLILPMASAPAQAASCRATMSSTFLQPSFPVFAWSANRYAQELGGMKAIGIRTVIDQWTVDMDANQAYYPTPSNWYPRGADMVGSLISTAGRYQMSVWLGLGNVYGWQTHATDYAWLQNQLYVDIQTANQLYALYPGRFKGWYISNEVDDKLLANPAAVGPMRWFFSELANYLHTHLGNLPVMASPTYSGLQQSPAQFAQGIKDVHGALDVVNVQDGGGSGYIGSSDITNWFTALSSALKGTRTALWSNADMFGGPNGPIDPVKLQNNLNATCGLVAANSGFSYTSQMSPLTLGTSTYYDAYQAYVAGR